MGEFKFGDEAPVDWFSAEAPSPLAIAMPVASAGLDWVPPANRDQRHDSALFSEFADCGPGAVTDAANGVCRPIPGLAEGFGAMGRIDEIMQAEMTKKETRRKLAAPNVAATKACLDESEALAEDMCAQGFMPARTRPDGMTDGECMDAWRNGSAGGYRKEGDVDQDTRTTGRTKGGTVGVEISAQLLGTGVKENASASLQATKSDTHATTRTDEELQNHKAYPGYVEECMTRARARIRDKT